MGDVVNLQERDEELEQAVVFVARYRAERGFQPWATTSELVLRDALGVDLKLYRFRAPGRQFALTADPGVRDALLAAGATNATPFKREQKPDAKQWWDVTLPPYLWRFI